MEYTLSVIIPVYKAEKYIAECVNSILAQTQEAIQIILVDDGSPDNSGIVCDTLAERNDNIVVVHKDNEGPSIARNIGIENSRGKYIAFIDSDDYVDSDYFKTMVSCAELNGSDVVFSKGYYTFDETADIKEYVCTNEFGTIESEEVKQIIPRLIHGLKGKNDIIYSSACFSLYKHEFLYENNIKFRNEHLCVAEDTLFVMNSCYYAKKISFVDVIGYYYRYNPNSLTHGYRKNRMNDLKKAMAFLEKTCESMALENYEERLALYFWDNYEKCINQEVRYVKYKNGINNLHDLINNDIAKRFMNVLICKKSLSGAHDLLCKLLLKQKVKIAYILLFFYNKLKH